MPLFAPILWLIWLKKIVSINHFKMAFSTVRVLGWRLNHKTKPSKTNQYHILNCHDDIHSFSHMNSSVMWQILPICKAGTRSSTGSNGGRFIGFIRIHFPTTFHFFLSLRKHFSVSQRSSSWRSKNKSSVQLRCQAFDSLFCGFRIKGISNEW